MVYIGQSVDICARWAQHRYCLSNNKHGNPILQNCYNKYGKGALTFKIEIECKRSELNGNESKFIEMFSGLFSDCLMNVRDAGNGNLSWRPISKEARKRMSDIAKNRPRRSEESRKKTSDKLRGRPVSQKSIDALILRNKRVYSQETRDKMSIAKKGKKITGRHLENLREAYKTRRNGNSKKTL
jgi:hypothetical protein